MVWNIFFLFCQDTQLSGRLLYIFPLVSPPSAPSSGSSSIHCLPYKGRAHIDIPNSSISSSVSLTSSLPFHLAFPSVLSLSVSTSSPFLPICHCFWQSCKGSPGPILSPLLHNQPLFLSPSPWKYLFSPRASQIGRHPSFPLSCLR